ncbi:MAG: tRNA (adenosine(37)-N6)-threonylcarbamoyltransferase complex ATPase subunit type 1 TsaE [Deferribacteraceae bacterium]|nr:tRNA (adenosine(37)-N6)-threonylcarbamoyltransferase complex ATPase subunit type 1 TsaE [Deferribacteraceae bacterium]
MLDNRLIITYAGESGLFADTYTEQELAIAAEKYLSALGDIKALLLSGELGAGKTTLAACILKAAGAQDIITSPTFTICNTYETPLLKGFILHADLYRIRSFAELEQTGFFELLEQAELTLIEWGEPIKDFLARYAEINILIDGEKRSYTFSKFYNHK